MILGSSEPFRRTHAAGVALGVARGLEYMHAQTPPVIHRDVKSPNILLDRHNIAKITGFGMARTKALNGAGNTALMSSVGSPDWVARPSLIPSLRIEWRR